MSVPRVWRVPCNPDPGQLCVPDQRFEAVRVRLGMHRVTELASDDMLTAAVRAGSVRRTGNLTLVALLEL